MKRILSALLFLIGLGALTACGGGDAAPEPSPAFEYAAVDAGELDYLRAIVGDTAICAPYMQDGTLLQWETYSLPEGERTVLGEIPAPNADVRSTVQIGEKLYCYLNEPLASEDAQGGSITSRLYEVDLAENTIRQLLTDKVDQTLIYADTIGTRVLAYKGRWQGDGTGVTYIDAVDVGRDPVGAPQVLISAQLDSGGETGTGEKICNFAQYGGWIYIITAAKDDPDAHWVYSIRQYDQDGTFLREAMFDATLTQLLEEGGRVSDFVVVGSYGFFNTFSSTGAVFDFSGKTAVAKHVELEDIDLALGARTGEKVPYALLYSRSSGQAWLLDAQGNGLHTLDLDGIPLRRIAVSDGTMALISSDTMLYADYLDIPILQTKTLNE